MLKLSRMLSLLLAVVIIFLVSGCSPVDKNYNVSSVTESTESKTEVNDTNDTKIMSADKIMPRYFDISLFDEENYSDVYLGKKFNITPVIDGVPFVVPAKLHEVEALGWTLTEGNSYDANSLVFSHETVDLYFENSEGIKIFAQVYNSSRSSQKLDECNIVKFKIDNAFYSSPDKYITFDVNGINNTMAITDVINILGVPSHFYKVSENSYYLDYFITKKDRRNGITVYINPVDDLISAVEFSFYK